MQNFYAVVLLQHSSTSGDTRVFNIDGIVITLNNRCILEWLFIVTSPRHTCLLIIPFNQHSDSPRLWWMDYLGKGEVRERFFITTREKCSVYIFVQCSLFMYSRTPCK